MLKRTSTVSLKSTRHITRKLEPSVAGEDPVHDRQSRVPNFNQMALNKSGVLLIGAGGLGGEVGEGLVRKGVGVLTIMDPDLVALSNLNRQRFYPKDLYRNKAAALAENLVPEATDSSLIIGAATAFQDWASNDLEVNADVMVCGVDNNQTRVAVAQFFLQTKPVVFLGVDELADHGYVFVQEVDGPCFGCLFPHALADAEDGECAKVGAVKDILKVVGGIALYAVDTLLMSRTRDWNYKEITLAGFAPDVGCRIERRPDCPICGNPVPATGVTTKEMES